MKKFLRKVSKRKGFTLIETLVVVAFMAILAGGYLMSAGADTAKARYAQAEKDLDTLLVAINAAYSDNGSFGTVTAGKAEAAFTGDFKTKLEKKLARPLSDVKDPWGNSYYITSSYVASTGKGEIDIECRDDAGTATRTNPNNNDVKIKRVVYNQ